MSIVQLRWGASREKQPQGWSTQEIAEFYRIADIMARAGLRVEIDQGVTDEGEPWLVFVRPETDDVVAHFARIDGFFVSVSSLTQDIYRGRDMRSVINQMLERHPLMVPRSGQGGALFLHPSVVLTAFVAAAFVMAIDEARAQTLEEILAGTPEASDGETPSLNNSEKTVGMASHVDTLGAREEENVEDITGYNHAALLGVVMLAYTLMSQEVEKFNLANVWDDQFAGTVDGYNLVPSVERVFAVDENAFHGGDAASDVGVTDKPAGAVVADMAIDGRAESIYQGNALLTSAHWSAFMRHAGEGHVQREQASADQGSLADFILLQGESGEDILQGIPEHTFDKNQSAVAVESRHDDGRDLPSITLAAREDPGPVTVRKEEAESADQTDIDISSENRGELFTVGVLAGNVFVEPTLRSASELEIPDDILADTISPVADREENEEKEEIIVVEDVPVLPIVGHHPGKETPSFSNAIDVLFYDGGDFAVSGFELGKDLLWFFLTPDQVSSAQSEMANEGDLVITFEGVGSLTLVGVLGGPAAAELI